ncbi:MAG: hypothetical protein MK135_17050, partial [Polyangiaceae bacterium]|nr:hypothetical protein [Polyangiaceae bacterium]
RPWLALRESCPIGRKARYPSAQISYHYDKSLSTLQQCLKAQPESVDAPPQTGQTPGRES